MSGEQTFWVEAGKQGFVVVLLLMALVIAGYVIRHLWTELKQEREARIGAGERVMVLAQEIKTALTILTDLVRAKP